ncbi:hypothetical protein K2Y11_24290, partial [bacterium]|nr:hypothetical protein [bacterium]
MRRTVLLGSLVTTLLAVTTSADGSVAGKVVQEAIEFVSKKFGKEVAKEGLETLAGKMSRLAARHGDDLVASAFKKVGPRAGQIASEAGEHGGVALRLLSKHGDEAIALAVNGKSLATVARYGDDAALALVKHGKVGEKLIEGYGQSGVQALTRITAQNGRRMAMLAAEGSLQPSLVSVIAAHGDRACAFIWRNKGALAVGSALSVFVASPEVFLNGTRELAAVVGDAAIKPLATLPSAVA